jgi:beta-lactamase regulating signal transducer with metallopeptidase domain
MIQQVMVYAITVAAALGLCGLCLERLASLQRLPRRTAWVVALLLSVLLPPVMILGTEPARTMPPIPAPAMQQAPIVLDPPTVRDTRSEFAISQPVAWQATQPQREWRLPRFSDRDLIMAWATASLLAGLYLLGAHLRMRRRIAGWQRATLLGHPVLVSETTGPALVGVFRPRLVIPRWLLDEPVATQALILEHERQHIAAHDPLLIRATVVLLAALPWNLPLWWQWRRLRQAIELDCDARVLRSGAEPQTYGEVLLAIAGRAARMPSGVVAMSEPVSALERRIQNLLPDPVRHAALQATGAIALLVAGISAALAINAPPNPARLTAATIGPAPSPAVTIEATPPMALPAAMIPAAAPAATSAAPAARTTGSAPPGRAPPPTAAPDNGGLSPFEFAMRAAVRKYPGLIESPAQNRDAAQNSGPALDGYTTLTVMVRADGTLYASLLVSEARVSEDGAPTLFDKVTAGPTREKIPKGQQIANLGRASDNLEVNWYVLRADFDESRDVTHVRNAVQARHAELMLPYKREADMDVLNANINVLTVFMTEDGQIARQAVESKRRTEVRSMDPPPLWITSLAMSDFFTPPPVPAEAFKVLGVNTEEIGQTGLLLVEPALKPDDLFLPALLPYTQQARSIKSVLEGVQAGDPREAVVVRYAWPRRPGEPIGGVR